MRIEKWEKIKHDRTIKNFWDKNANLLFQRPQWLDIIERTYHPGRGFLI